LARVALGRQARAHGELALADQRTQLVGDLAIEALGFDGLQGHGEEKVSRFKGCPELDKCKANSEYDARPRATHRAKPESETP
jgi:hypothetical protein